MGVRTQCNGQSTYSRLCDGYARGDAAKSSGNSCRSISKLSRRLPRVLTCMQWPGGVSSVHVTPPRLLQNSMTLSWSTTLWAGKTSNP
eukprot:5942193-Prymnesium_polylepis.2